jgi:ABC-type branched-subunit amino acid transport system ATPase component
MMATTRTTMYTDHRPDTTPLLEVRGLNVAYGDVQVLWDIDLVIHAGETVALVGSNGAGKSTLLSALSGLMNPLSGSIRVNGVELARQPSGRFVQAGICHVPQGRRLFVGMTVRENLMMGAFSRTDGAAAIRQDFEQVLALFPRVKERLNQLAGKLSGGEQQMVAIGRGLMARPHLLMIDELSLGLSPIMVDTIFDVITAVQAQGRTMLIVEQDIQAALEHATRGYVLDTGRITHEGRSADLLASDTIRSAYLGI